MRSLAHRLAGATLDQLPERVAPRHRGLAALVRPDVVRLLGARHVAERACDDDPLPFRLFTFFFAGTVFPLESLPRGLRPFAELMPLTHPVRLTRSLLTGRWSAVLLADLAFLIVVTVLAGWYGIRRLRARIIV